MPAIPYRESSATAYNFESRIFPLDLGQSDNDHFMMININVPSTVDNINTPASSFTDITTPMGERSKMDRLRFGGDVPNWQYQGNRILPGVKIDGAPAVGGDPGNRAFVALPRRTVRIRESIALHMPSPLVFNTQNRYEEVSLTALAGKLGAAALSVVGGGFGALGNAKAGVAIGGALGKIAGVAGNIAGAGAKLLQRPINPAVEVLFATTELRQFTFEVLMAPRNEKESEAIKEIIYALRFHSAPEVSGVTVDNIPVLGRVSGLFWIPPAEFDISFWHRGKSQNNHILGINTCVMERIEVDYSPSGIYSTFHNGHPVAVRLSMGFRELEPIHKQRIRQGM